MYNSFYCLDYCCGNCNFRYCCSNETFLIDQSKCNNNVIQLDLFRTNQIQKVENFTKTSIKFTTTPSMHYNYNSGFLKRLFANLMNSILFYRNFLNIKNELKNGLFEKPVFYKNYWTFYFKNKKINSLSIPVNQAIFSLKNVQI